MLVLVDQITKLIFFQKSIPLARFVSLSFTQNTGTIFGLFQRTNLVFIILSAIILLLLLLLYRSHPHLQSGFNFIIAGAIGNLADRIRLGYVVDFIDVYGWPVFNVADALIVLGILMVLFMALREQEE